MSENNERNAGGEEAEGRGELEGASGQRRGSGIPEAPEGWEGEVPPVPGQPEEGEGRMPEGGPNNRQRAMVGLLCLLVALVLGRSMLSGFAGSATDEITTNQFVVAVKEDRISDVTFKVSDGSLTGTYWPKEDDRGNAGKLVSFTSHYVGSDSLQELMARHPRITFKVNTQTDEILELLLTVGLPTVLMAGLMLFFLNKIQGQNGQAMSFGRASKARTTAERRPKVKFSDVAGIDEVVEELEEVRDFLSEPERYHRMGAKIPRGLLLVGPPGTGKTLLAKAVAGEAGVPFFSISGSDFVEMFVGVGASRVRDLFRQAKESAPSIIFIDEIDAVGRQRGTGLGGGHDEREQTLNQLLVEMDGFDDNTAVILVAATNRPDVLDPALLRPGRFDRQITVDAPDVKGREMILAVHGGNKPLDESVDYERVARMTPGFTGAELANLMNEAALLAARRNEERIGMPQIEEAMERVIAGPEKKGRVMTEAERRTIAYHEGGHALVGHVLSNSDPVHKISIVGRGRALGYTLQMPEEDRALETRGGMLDRIAVLLAGRTAEELFCDDITTGASNDLERATKIARAMAMRYGMSDELGTQVYGEPQHEVFLGRDYADHSDFSNETARRIDAVVENVMREGHERADAVLAGRRPQMEALAQVLLQRETVEGELLEALLGEGWAAYLAEHPELLGQDASRDGGDTPEDATACEDAPASEGVSETAGAEA